MKFSIIFNHNRKSASITRDFDNHAVDFVKSAVPHLAMLVGSNIVKCSIVIAFDNGRIKRFNVAPNHVVDDFRFINEMIFAE